jgi:hypothetical protein
MRVRAFAVLVVVAAVLFAPTVARAFQRVDSRSMAPGGRWATSSETPPAKAVLHAQQCDTVVTVDWSTLPPIPNAPEPERRIVESVSVLESPFDASPDPLRGPPSL